MYALRIVYNQFIKNEYLAPLIKNLQYYKNKNKLSLNLKIK